MQPHSHRYLPPKQVLRILSPLHSCAAQRTIYQWSAQSIQKTNKLGSQQPVCSRCHDNSASTAAAASAKCRSRRDTQLSFLNLNSYAWSELCLCIYICILHMYICIHVCMCMVLFSSALLEWLVVDWRRCSNFVLLMAFLPLFLLSLGLYIHTAC